MGENLFELFPKNSADSSKNVDDLKALLNEVIENGRENSENIQRYDIEVGDSGIFEERYFKQKHTPVFNNEGELKYILKIVEDVTDKIHRDHEHKLLFNDSETSFVLVGLDNKIISFNREFELLYESLTGKTLEKKRLALDLVQPERHGEVKGIFERVLLGETIEYELSFLVESGDFRYFKIKYKPAVDSDGNIFGAYISHMEITNEKLALQKLQENEARFRALVEKGNDVLFVLSPEGKPTYISPSVENVLGYTLEEAENMDLFSCVHPDDIPHVQSELSKCLENPGVPIEVTPARMKHKDGSWRWFDGTITNMLQDPAINGIVDNFKEITTRVEMEEKLELARQKYKSLVQSVDGVFWEAKADTFDFTYVSLQAEEMLGYSMDEWLSEPDFWQNRIHSEDRDDAVGYCHRETGKGRNHEFEYRFKKSDGSYIWLKDVVTVINKEGKPDLLRGLMLDITDRKNYQKNLLTINTQLKERIKEQKCIYAISQLDEQKLSVESLLRKSVEIIPSGFQYAEDARVSITWKDQLFQTENYSETPVQLKVKSRRLKDWPFVIVVCYRVGKSQRNQKTFQDEERSLLTSIKDQLAIKIEKILQKKELHQRNAYIDATINSLPIGVATHRVSNGMVTLSNPKFAEIYGWPKNSFHTVDDFFEHVYPDEEYRKIIKKRILSDIASRDSGRMQWNGIEITTKSGKKKIVNAKNIPLFEQDLMISTVVDVTAEKESENERVRLLESISDAYFALDSNWRFTYLNCEAEKLLKKSRSDMIGQNMWDVFADLNETKIYTTYQNVLENHIPASIEYFYETINTWFDISIYPNNGGLSVFFSDINERVERETKLRDLSLVAAKTTDSVIITDAKERITWVNDAFTKLSGYSLEECKGLVPGDLLQGPETSDDAKRNMHRGIKEQVPVEEVILNYSKEGTPYWLEINIDPIFNEEGECTHFIAIQRDVTDKVEREQELKRTVERYDIVSKATSDTIWDFDLSEDTMHYNNNIFTMFGYTHDEVNYVASWWRDKIHPDDQLYVSQELRNAIYYRKDRFQMEYRFRCADGSFKHIYDRAFLIKDHSGEPVRMIGAMQDVTKMVEEQEQMKLLQSVITNTNESVVITNAEAGHSPGGNIVYVNDAFTAMTGYEEEEVIGKTTDFLTGPQTNTEKRGQLYTSMKTSGAAEIELINYKKDGEEFWIHTSGVPVENRDGDSSHWVFISRDITDQKEQEKKILSSLKEKETLLAEIHHRVKNNLAVVSSLMELQAMNSEDEVLQDQLMSSVMRIKSMATIHEQLYQSSSFSNLQFSDGLKRLVNNVVETLQATVEIELTYELENVEMSINQGIPCSLLVNEIITNILKHGYKGRESGEITIRLWQSNETIKLEIEDDGNGLPDNFETLSSVSMGMQLIELLTEQLKGEKKYRSDETGTLFSLGFSRNEDQGVGSSYVN